MFTELESSLADERRDWFNNKHALLLDNLLACIREQQAAIEALLDYHENDNPHGVAHSRAVLEKWRIE
jgi:hypothetical protein